MAGIMAAIIFVALAGILIVEEGKVILDWIAVFAVGAVVGGAASAIAGLRANLACAAAPAKKSGLLDRYTLTDRDAGVHTRPNRADVLVKWPAVRVRRIRN